MQAGSVQIGESEVWCPMRAASVQRTQVSEVEQLLQFSEAEQRLQVSEELLQGQGVSEQT